MRQQLLELCLAFGEHQLVSELLKLKPKDLDIEALLEGTPIPESVRTRIGELHDGLTSGELKPNPEFNRIIGCMLRYGGYNKQSIARGLRLSPGHFTRMCSGERKVRPRQVEKCRALLAARMKAQVQQGCEMRREKFEILATSHQVGTPVADLTEQLRTIALAKLFDAWFDSESGAALPAEIPAVILKLSGAVHVIVTTGDAHTAHEYYALSNFFLEQARKYLFGEHNETTEQWHERELSKLGPPKPATEPLDNPRK